MLVLIRYLQTEDLIQGILFWNGEWIADTLELPWRSNIPNVSSIPEGQYSLTYREGAEFHVKKGYLLDAVPERLDILIHAANLVGELRGCIAVGTKARRSLERSTEALDRIHQTVGDTAKLKIIGVTDELLSMWV